MLVWGVLVEEVREACMEEFMLGIFWLGVVVILRLGLEV